MIYLRSEPRDEHYRRFIRFLAGYCDSFCLVERRRRLKPHKSAREVIARLGPFLLERSDVKEWAGTKLGGGAGSALLARYRLVPESLDILTEQNALYDWVLPKLPEDLAFYAADGKCFFSATSHEREAMLRSGRVTEQHFAMQNPGVEFTWFAGER